MAELSLINPEERLPDLIEQIKHIRGVLLQKGCPYRRYFLKRKVSIKERRQCQNGVATPWQEIREPTIPWVMVVAMSTNLTRRELKFVTNTTKTL